MCKCMKCDHDLKKVSEENLIYPNFDGEGGSKSEYVCQYCGTYYSVFKDEEDNEESTYNTTIKDECHGVNMKCPECGAYLVWSSDFMRSEVWGDVENEDEDSLVSYFTCPFCNCTVEVVEPNSIEIKRFPYFNDNEQ